LWVQFSHQDLGESYKIGLIINVEKRIHETSSTPNININIILTFIPIHFNFITKLNLYL